MPEAKTLDAEAVRLAEDGARRKNWKRWGPYLAARQWGTVREDYSAEGTCWEYFPHDHARSRAYRWGEDGLLGLCDREGRLCFALALWNGRDPILKERLFGLTNAQGNHAEDGTLLADHLSLGHFHLACAPGPNESAPEWLFTDNETNTQKLFGAPNSHPFVKDAFHEFVVHGRVEAVNPAGVGTKAAAHYR